MADEARHLVISGKVQGVGYRAFVRDHARRLGLRGWVRNRADGTVEALVSGEAADLAQLIQACRAGPAHARIDGIAVTNADDEPTDTLTDFLVLRDG